MATHVHTTDADRRRSTRRTLLLGAAVLPGAAAAAPLASPLPPGPDAKLIAICNRHPSLIAAFTTSNGDGSDSDPTWAAYAASRDAISDAQPQTLAGMRAKALAAKAEAVTPDGGEEYRSSVAGAWSWDLVNDLQRLTGGAA